MLVPAHHSTATLLRGSPGRIAAGVLLVGFAGAVAGWLLPRGPVTTAEAMVTLLAALAVGVGAGWSARTRWVLLGAPVTFMVVFELARMRVDGPTVDGIPVNGLYGVIALVGGRGVDALLVMLPLLVGCGWGLVLARRLHRPAAVARPTDGAWCAAASWCWPPPPWCCSPRGCCGPRRPRPFSEPTARRWPAASPSSSTCRSVATTRRSCSAACPPRRRSCCSSKAAPAAPRWAGCATPAKTSSRTSSSPPGTSAAPASPTTRWSRPPP